MSLKWLGAIPWFATLAGTPFVNQAEPFVLGLPLPLAWVTGCIVLTTAMLALTYRLDPANTAADGRAGTDDGAS